MRQLRIPYQFVGVQRFVAVSASAVLMHIGSQLHPPRQCNVYRTSVSKLPGVEVVLQLQLIFRMGIGK